MATLTYHRKPGGTTYVYRQESYWDKSKKRSATRQVCIGKLGKSGEIIYNKRFSDPAAREALERGSEVTESVVTGQSLVLDAATETLGLERVIRSVFDAKLADALISLAWSVVALDGKMYHAQVWCEENECPLHDDPPSSQEISRILASVTQGEIEDFLRVWMGHRGKGGREQYCFDITSISSYCTNNAFAEYGYNRDDEHLPQINLALLSGVASRIPTYYEVLPGSMSDVVTVKTFCERMKKYGVGRIRMILDRGFYSLGNIERFLKDSIGFYIPVPAHIKASRVLIDEHRDALEMPEHIIEMGEGSKDCIYGMTVLSKIAGKRIWQHIYYDTARRTEHILSFFAKLKLWEEELVSGNIEESNKEAYKRYFTVKNTPKRGRKVTRNQDAVNEYKVDRAGCWVIITNCEKDAQKALLAYRERSLVESQFDDLKNELDMGRLRTHNSDTMRGRVFVQFLALIICSQIRVTLNEAWENRRNVKTDALGRRYSLSELMLRLGSYRKTRFSGRYGEVVSTPTRAQRQIFKAFGMDIS